MSDKPSGFFSRWQQRRQQVAEEAEKELQQPDVTETIEQQQVTEIKEEASTQAVVESEDENRILTAEELPDPDKIEQGGSFAAFMAKNVDPLAKKAALRALWKQPHFNEVDGLAEYALDYSNQPKLSAEDSAELVKKVFRRVIEREEKEKAEQEEAARLASQQQADAEQGTAETAQLVEPTEQVEQIEDSLNEGQHGLTQNVPDEPSQPVESVVKGQFS